MKTRYYLLISIVCFSIMLYYFASDWQVSHPWEMNIGLFFIGEISFALALGKFMKRNREYHEKYIWKQDENSEI